MDHLQGHGVMAIKVPGITLLRTGRSYGVAVRLPNRHEHSSRDSVLGLAGLVGMIALSRGTSRAKRLWLGVGTITDKAARSWRCDGNADKCRHWGHTDYHYQRRR